MNNKNIENRIKKIILIKEYVNSFIKNKDNDLFINIFIMYVNDLDKELEIIKIKKTKKSCKKLYNNNQFFYYSFINLLENGQNWKNINYICSYSTYYRKFKWKTYIY